MFENEEGTAVRLYGPTRRARTVTAVVPLPSAGMAYATFDNFGSWVRYKQVSYSLRLTGERPEPRATTSTLRYAKGVHQSAEAEEERRRAAAATAEAEPRGPTKSLAVTPGVQEEVSFSVSAGSRLLVSVEVTSGRDIDFGIMLECEGGADGERAIRLFGPCRRATKILANVTVPEAGVVHLGFDAPSTWGASLWGPRKLNYCCEVLRDETI